MRLRPTLWDIADGIDELGAAALIIVPLCLLGLWKAVEIVEWLL